MLNKLLKFIRQYHLIDAGDKVVCAVSGGADSVALLFSLYLLQEKLGFTLSAAHFNHHLRGEESNQDEAFVRSLCDRYNIELFVGSANVITGKKGLEAAARDARYAFFDTLPGKIATAHTADDNAETVLMHLVRGTGLKGLGGIAPENGKLIRPMLSVTRQDVLSFLQEYHLRYVQDSSNETDDFLRNRLRHHVMPLLAKENPRFAENTSQTSLRLREDEQMLANLAADVLPSVSAFKQLPESVRNRAYVSFLEENGVKEPEAEHIKLLHKLVLSDNPSAKAYFPGNIMICRNYGKLEKVKELGRFITQELPMEGDVFLPEIGVTIACNQATEPFDNPLCFTVQPKGKIFVRCRAEGDTIRLSGGTKSLKKLFIDKKIPARQRCLVPVIADELGVIAVVGFGPNLDRLTTNLPAVTITIKEKKE